MKKKVKQIVTHQAKENKDELDEQGGHEYFYCTQNMEWNKRWANGEGRKVCTVDDGRG